MKLTRLTFFAAAALLLTTQTAFASEVRVGDSRFVKIEGLYTNSCDDTKSGGYDGACHDEKSEAAQACTNEGGHLPSVGEFSELIRSFKSFGNGLVEEREVFHSGQVPALTVGGSAYFFHAFELPTTSIDFWTSSSHVTMPDERPMTNAWVFNLSVYQGELLGGAFTAGRTFRPQAVICVLN